MPHYLPDTVARSARIVAALGFLILTGLSAPTGQSSVARALVVSTAVDKTPLAKAGALLEQSQADAAIDVLILALATNRLDGDQRRQAHDLLVRAYTEAIAEAERRDDPVQARIHRGNLAMLQRRDVRPQPVEVVPEAVESNVSTEDGPKTEPQPPVRPESSSDRPALPTDDDPAVEASSNGTDSPFAIDTSDLPGSLAEKILGGIAIEEPRRLPDSQPQAIVDGIGSEPDLDTAESDLEDVEGGKAVLDRGVVRISEDAPAIDEETNQDQEIADIFDQSDFPDVINVPGFETAPRPIPADDPVAPTPIPIEKTDPEPAYSDSNPPTPRPLTNSSPIPIPIGRDSSATTAPSAATPDRGRSPIRDKSTDATPEVEPPTRSGSSTMSEIGREVREADEAFRARRYHEAGRIYGDLARDGVLPGSRRQYWWYCRCVTVRSRIEEATQQRGDWRPILAEIQDLQQLHPEHWFNEYLLSMALDRSGIDRRSIPPAVRRSGSRSVVVRANNPGPEDRSDEPGRRPSRDRSAPESTMRSDGVPIGRAGQPVGPWQTWETPNFRIYYRGTPRLVQVVAATTERARAEQFDRWAGHLPDALRRPWSPKCEVFLHAQADSFRDATGQRSSAEGITTIRTRMGQVVARRIDLRDDGAGLMHSVIPHEVTHVVLADLFPDQPLDRWADEGIAAMAEPDSYQQRYLDQFVEATRRGGTPNLREFLGGASPATVTDAGGIAEAARDWELHDSQGVALVGYLVRRGSPAHLIAFLQFAQREGYEPALQRIYGIDSLEQLEDDWLGASQS